MPLSSIAYSSQTAEGLTVDQLNALVRDAAHHNKLAGVTGVLLCDGNRFLQYLEGPEEGVQFVYARVQNSKRHSNLVELGRGDCADRRFPYWSMHWIPVEQHELHAAAVANWTAMTAGPDPASGEVSGPEQVARIIANHLEAGEAAPRQQP